MSAHALVSDSPLAPDYGDTITLWSLRDFLRSKRMSKDVLELGKRQHRASELKRRRSAEDEGPRVVRVQGDRATVWARKLEELRAKAALTE